MTISIILLGGLGETINNPAGGQRETLSALLRTCVAKRCGHEPARQVAVHKLRDHLTAHVCSRRHVHLLLGAIQYHQQRGAVFQVSKISHLVTKLVLCKQIIKKSIGESCVIQ